MIKPDHVGFGGGLISAFTYLQASAPNLDITIPKTNDLKHAAIAGLISLVAQLVLKLGGKLIDLIGQRKAARKEQQNIPPYPKP